MSDDAAHVWSSSLIAEEPFLFVLLQIKESLLFCRDSNYVY